MGFKKIALTGAFALGAVATLSAADSLHMKFPQAKNYGTMPSGSKWSHAEIIEAQYKRYVDTWYKDQGYVESPDTHGDGATVSEAHGYGMMIFAIMGDKEKFDKMVTYYQAHKAVGNLMNWTVDGNWQGGSATDGDLDMAYAFLLAAQQWNDDSYLTKALAISDDILNYDMNSSGDFLALGSSWTDRVITRPSDWMAGHLRAFAKVDNGSASTWNGVATEIYTRYNSFVNTNNTSGLISDFVKNGQPADGGETAHDKEYFTNAGRVPMRFAMDFARTPNNANEAALKTLTDKLVALCDGNATDFKAGYKLDGTSISSDNGLEFLAPYGAGLIVNSDKNLINSAWNELQQDWTKTSHITSFGDALKLLSMLVMTGNWWTYGDGDTYEEKYIDTLGVVLDNFGNSYGDDNAQCELGAANGVAWGDNEFGGTNGDTTYYKGGGYWYAYSGDGARIKSSDGTVIAEDNTDKIVTDYRLDVTFEADAEDEKSYDYAALEVPFICDITHNGDSSSARYVNLDSLTGITIQYKSSADLSVVVATKDERERVPADADGWIGSYKMKLPASAEMVRTTFPVADILPESGSPLADSVKAGWSELTGLKEAIAFAFMLGEDADKGAKVDLQVEDIILNGVEYMRDFNVDYRPAGIINSNNSVTQSSFAPMVTPQGITLNFNAAEATEAMATLYSIDGRQVANVRANAAVGLNKVNFSNDGLANGMYVVRLQVGNAVSTARVNLTK